MPRRAAPLLIDRLPLFATDRELAPAIMGERAAEWPARMRFYEARGFPKINALMGGRYVPAVIAFFDRVEGGDASNSLPDGTMGEQQQWTLPKLKRRGSSGARAQAAG